MRELTRREHERYGSDEGERRPTEEVNSSAGGEASDPQLCLWGSTRVSADKAVALYMGVVPWDEE